MKDKWTRFEFRKNRISEKIRGKSTLGERPRLCVHRSLRYIYAQVLDDKKGKTLAYASSLSKEIRSKVKSTAGIEAAKAVGGLIGKKAQEAGVKRVAFDRGGRLYHGRIKALAEAARSAGLEF